jgi:SAM-dependent methyltransferase
LLVDRGAAVAGIDYSLPTIRKACERGGEGAYYCVGDAAKLPFRLASFDGALCLGVTQALAESGPLVKSLAASVRPGGEVWIDALNGSCLVHCASRIWRRLRGRPPHLRYERVSTVRRLMMMEGLESIEVVWMPMFPPRLSRLQRWLETKWMRSLLRLVPAVAALGCHSFLVRGQRMACKEQID